MFCNSFFASFLDVYRSDNFAKLRENFQVAPAAETSGVEDGAGEAPGSGVWVEKGVGAGQAESGQVAPAAETSGVEDGAGEAPGSGAWIGRGGKG